MLLGCLLLFAAGQPAGSVGGAPAWSDDELRRVFIQINAAAAQPNLQAKDNQLADIVGSAYRVAHLAGETRDAYVKRVLKLRSPDHPNVKNDQWLMAIYRQFYTDLAARADVISRLAKDRRDRQYFSDMARMSKDSAVVAGGQLQVSIDGLDGFTAPLPQLDGRPPEKSYGVVVQVHQGAISVDKIDRAKWPNYQVPANAERTGQGAVKVLYDALLQYNITAKMLGEYEPKWRKNSGNLRAIIPATTPALYLNEIAHAAQQVGIRRIHLMTTAKSAALNELTLLLNMPKKRGSKAASVFSCSDALLMQKCAERLAETHKEVIAYAVP